MGKFHWIWQWISDWWPERDICEGRIQVENQEKLQNKGDLNYVFFHDWTEMKVQTWGRIRVKVRGEGKSEDIKGIKILERF